MRKEQLETILKMIPATYAMDQIPKNQHIELQDNVLASGTHELSQKGRFDGVVIGTVMGFKDSGEPLVDFSANTTGEQVQARSTVALGTNQIGREVTLVFENGDPHRPIIMGVIQLPEPTNTCVEYRTSEEQSQLINVEIDGERLLLKAQKEIVLRCGEASITLTRAGKVLIRGTYLLSRSSGANKIKGGSIDLN